MNMNTSHVSYIYPKVKKSKELNFRHTCYEGKKGD
jgi:hypothetical protein